MGAEQRVAVVTGSGRGIGREYALALARAGFAVAVADLDPAGAGETTDLIEKEQGVARAAVPVKGQPRDLTSALLFFASEDSRWVTGQTLIVDGGLSTRL